jgi:hypothetical protein
MLDTWTGAATVEAPLGLRLASPTRRGTTWIVSWGAGSEPHRSADLAPGLSVPRIRWAAAARSGLLECGRLVSLAPSDNPYLTALI